MSDAPVQTQGGLELQPPLPVRRLHNFIYCPRLFYFQWVENIFQENADTVAGSHLHRNVDKPSKVADPKELDLPEGAKLRSLQLQSETLGLIGVVDIIEGTSDGAEIIDYKKGSARRDSEGDRVAKEPDAMKEIMRDVPIGRLGRAGEIASVVLWLCSPGSSFVIGHALVVDGGYTVH